MAGDRTGSAPLDEAIASDFLERLRSLFNAHDPALFTSMMAPDVVFDHPLARTMHGRDEISAFYTNTLWKAMPDAHVEPADGPYLHPQAPRIIMVWTGSGTNLGPLDPPGLAPTGRLFQTHVWEMFELRDGAMTRVSQAFDTAAVMRELGVLPAQGSRAERVMAGLQRVWMKMSRQRRKLSEGHPPRLGA